MVGARRFATRFGYEIGASNCSLSSLAEMNLAEMNLAEVNLAEVNLQTSRKPISALTSNIILGNSEPSPEQVGKA